MKPRKPIKRTRIKARPKKNPMPEGRRREIFERDGWACRNCGRPVDWVTGQVHHGKKLSQGGGHEAGNLYLFCGVPNGEIPACHPPRIHHECNERYWIWQVGTGDDARFVSEKPGGDK